MKLKQIKIQNFRLLRDVTLDIENKITLIVGKNNSGKTSFMDFLSKVLNNNKLRFDDCPIRCRRQLYEDIYDYLIDKIAFNDLIEKIPKTKITFLVDYSDEATTDNLGFLSNFIIDVDDDIEEAIISAEYFCNINESKFDNLFVEVDTRKKDESIEKIKTILKLKYGELFNLMVFAINPGDLTDKLPKTISELNNLLRIHKIVAERELDETDMPKESPLGNLLNRLFKDDIEKTFPELKDKIKALHNDIAQKNDIAQEDVNKSLTEIIQKAVKIGYPNEKKIKLQASTNLKLENQIKSNTDLQYLDNELNESLPSGYNGLGYKNLLKIEFELASFAQEINTTSKSIIPILLIEEPESHMHPQLQQKFIKYVSDYIGNLYNQSIQSIITTHSSHISCEVDFKQIRYAKRYSDYVLYENLTDFAKKDEENLDFITKYLTITKCDLFFADKIILVEGTAERLLIPDMINKCDSEGLFGDKDNMSLRYQYYTILEVGGAYAYKFFKFLDFLNIPSLIITDIDSTNKNTNHRQAKCLVSEAETTSNKSIKEWFILNNDIKKSEDLTISDVTGLEKEKKTIKNKHIEYQTFENNLCGRSLEEAIKNSNRIEYSVTKEEDLEFDSNNEKKTDFAIELLMKKNYNVPQYIKDGLIWLSKQDTYVDGDIDE
ncbi:MAG: AAA family ATPase [Bacilli bacterium]|nr:AAA family ATPase [Bacilli bacterium]